MAQTVPYYCPRCWQEHGPSQYHGVLVFPHQDIPTCSHHTNDTNNPDLVRMVPVAERNDARTHADAGRP